MNWNFLGMANWPAVSGTRDLLQNFDVFRAADTATLPHATCESCIMNDQNATLAAGSSAPAFRLLSRRALVRLFFDMERAGVAELVIERTGTDRMSVRITRPLVSAPSVPQSSPPGQSSAPADPR
jgi:hypothetical protein